MGLLSGFNSNFRGAFPPPKHGSPPPLPHPTPSMGAACPPIYGKQVKIQIRLSALSWDSTSLGQHLNGHTPSWFPFCSGPHFFHLFNDCQINVKQGCGYFNVSVSFSVISPVVLALSSPTSQYTMNIFSSYCTAVFLSQTFQRLSTQVTIMTKDH